MSAATFSFRPRCKWFHLLNLGISEDLSKVMVKVGKDFFVELSQDETLHYISKKETVLNRRSELLT